MVATCPYEERACTQCMAKPLLILSAHCDRSLGNPDEGLPTSVMSRNQRGNKIDSTLACQERHSQRVE